MGAADHFDSPKEQKSSTDKTELQANVLFHQTNSAIRNAQVQKLHISCLIGCRRPRFKLFRYYLLLVQGFSLW